jgi:Lon protease-like protein
VSETEKNGNLEAALSDLPVFPLPQVVLFPRALLPLHIFEPRYLAMLKDCLAGHRHVVMASLLGGGRSTSEQRDAVPRLNLIAGVGFIVEHQALTDGRANVVVQGRARVRITEIPSRDPFRHVRATRLEDDAKRVSQADRTALVTAAGAYAGEIGRRDPRFSFSVPPNLDTGALADICAHHLILSADMRQTMLEELDTSLRVQSVIREIATQHSALLHESGGVLH